MSNLNEVKNYIKEVEYYINDIQDICQSIYRYGKAEVEDGTMEDVDRLLGYKMESTYLKKIACKDGSYYQVTKELSKLKAIVKELEDDIKYAEAQLNNAYSVKRENDKKIYNNKVKTDILDARKQRNLEYENVNKDVKFLNSVRQVVANADNFKQSYQNNRLGINYTNKEDNEYIDLLTKNYSLAELKVEDSMIRLDNANYDGKVNAYQYNEKIKDAISYVSDAVEDLKKEAKNIAWEMRRIDNLDHYTNDYYYRLDHGYYKDPNEPRFVNYEEEVRNINNKIDEANEIANKSNLDVYASEKKLVQAKMQLMRRLYRSEKSEVGYNTSLANEFNKAIIESNNKSKVRIYENDSVNKKECLNSLEMVDKYLGIRSKKLNKQLQKDLLKQERKEIREQQKQELIEKRNEVINKAKDKFKNLFR
ncbi:MAG: hypothetical protein II309_03585 [Bacilli bacterium]|nr:hypothetical protein [Bacilli bacterium]